VKTIGPERAFLCPLDRVPAEEPKPQCITTLQKPAWAFSLRLLQLQNLARVFRAGRRTIHSPSRERLLEKEARQCHRLFAGLFWKEHSPADWYHELTSPTMHASMVFCSRSYVDGSRVLMPVCSVLLRSALLTRYDRVTVTDNPRCSHATPNRSTSLNGVATASA
jgi:hypothetical protein